ncbi:MAG: aldehyde dehydrogenase [Candidatus Eisenbacteria bacterium]|uniref:Aldehyde dehydrogenase n=1 Tax=Eiseniibacteriota bacterium TaxID=2212470 RepID=A0A956LXC3_UNCEI|nr:aldehyde dehydrogenase [Candidatus Eisenbacteria bacterium]
MTDIITAPVLHSLNPATGEVVGSVPITPVREIPAMIQRAREAQREWRRMSLEDRAACLVRGGKVLVERADELGRLLTREMGKPLREGVGEVRGCGAWMEEETRDIAAALQPDHLEDERTISTVFHDPYGVCAAITPWNFPISMPHSLVIPALMAGNTVILKPSEETPLIAQAYVEVLSAFLPSDVLSIVHGADEQGKALVAGDVDIIAFTGSRETGKKILGSASGGLKRVILELGGKDPLVVLHDADIDKAARFAALNSFRNAGQVCVSTERIYVDERIAPEFEQALLRHAGELPVGAGEDESTRIGPMINLRQRDHVLSHVDDAVKKGAHVLGQGPSAQGNFLQPTVLTGVSHEMDIMREETFGPVACVMRFRNDDEAIALANDTPFGLGAAVFGEEEHAAQIGRQLDAGMIGINKGCGGAAGSPWVGAKQSGYGYHSSREGHRQFTQARVVSRSKPS